MIIALLLGFDLSRAVIGARSIPKETIVSIETIVALFKDTDSSRQVLKELYEVGFKNEFWVIGDTTEGGATNRPAPTPSTARNRSMTAPPRKRRFSPASVSPKRKRRLT